MAHLVSRLILIASSALFMASPVKKRVGGQLTAVSCQQRPVPLVLVHFLIVRREREIICKQK
jgi:hypothetical protein